MKRTAAFVAALSLLYSGCGGSGAGLSAGDATPRLILSTGSLDLHAMLGGAVVQGTCTVTAQSVSSFTAAVSNEQPVIGWCSTTILGSNLTVSASPSGPLPPGEYTATVTVSDPSGDAADQQIDVTFTVHEWTFAPDPPDVVCTPVSEPSTIVQTSNITVVTDPAQDWTAAVSNELPTAGWCTVTASGASGTDLVVTADPTGLTVNTYTATVTVSSANMADTTFTVELGVLPPSGIFPADTVMYFSLEEGYTPAAAQQTTVNVYSPAEIWNATDDQTWCGVTASGNDGDPLTVTVNTGLTYGIYSATVTISSASHSDAYIDVQVSVSHAGTWGLMTSGTSAQLNGLHGTASNNVYCVGEGGIILHFDGTDWTEMTHGLTTENLMDVWCVDASNIFAVGASGTILHCDGTTWTTMTSGVTDGLVAVWGSSASDVHAVWCSGHIYYGGSSWATDEGIGCAYGIHGIATNDIWTCGAGNRMDHYDGSGWQMQSPYVDADHNRMLEDVWGLPGGDFFFVGRGNSFPPGPGDDLRAPFIHYDGTNWTVYDVEFNIVDQNLRLFAVWAASPTDVWMAGVRNNPVTIYHFDGLTVQPVSNWTLGDMTWIHFYDMWGASATDIFVCGSGGTIVRFQ